MSMSHQETGHNHHILLKNLPELVLLHIARYLSVEQKIVLSQTCKSLYLILPKFLRIKGKDFDKRGPYDGHWCPERYFDGPRLRRRVKTLKMWVSWKDQGFGNRK